MRMLFLSAILVSAALRIPSYAQAPPAISTANLSTPDFEMGVDLSLLSFIEDHGVQYMEGGQPGDPLAIFKAHGCNYVRLRLFVRPAGTEGQVNTLPYTLELAKRVKRAGLSWLLDLHYSDGWADPGHQNIPAEWKSLPHAELAERVFVYTRDTLAAFEREGCLPDLVQVGNEVTNGMMWPAGGPLKTAADFDAFADLLKAGIRAVRETAPADRIGVMIHVDRGGKKEVCQWFFDNCRKRGVSFDVIGLSYYPLLHGSLDDLSGNLSSLAQTYQKDIVVVETDYNSVGDAPKAAPFPFTPAGQQAFLEELLRRVAATPGGHGKGVFYWAPEWIAGEKWYDGRGSGQWEDCALFDRAGNALPALGAFQSVSATAK